jgi:peptide/nickel transport system substrate-binding protein
VAVDGDGDGVLDRDGVRFAFVYSTRRSPLREQITGMVQAQLKAYCQVETMLELYEGEYFADGPAGLLFGRRYDLAEFAWLTGPEPPCELYHSAAVPDDVHGWSAPNVTGYVDPAFDAACDAARYSLDEQARAAWHAEALQLWNEALPALPLFNRARVLVTRVELPGVRLDASSQSELADAEYFTVLR